MIVHRVEDSHGRGPFDWWGVSEACYWYHDSFPSPRFDGLETGAGDVCGCQTEQLFDHWWPREFWQPLAAATQNALGYARFEVDPSLVRLGKHQCIFPRAQAQRLSFITFNVLLLKGETSPCQSVA